MGLNLPLHSSGKRPASPRPTRPSRHERMSAVEARALFPLGGNNAARKGRFPVVAREFRTLDGITFDSRLEMEFYAELRQRELAGEIRDIEYHPSFPVEISGKPYAVYTADFSFVELMPASGLRIVDVKSTGSRKDAAFKLRKKAAELAHGIKIEEIVRR